MQRCRCRAFPSLQEAAGWCCPTVTLTLFCNLMGEPWGSVCHLVLGQLCSTEWTLEQGTPELKFHLYHLPPVSEGTGYLTWVMPSWCNDEMNYAQSPVLGRQVVGTHSLLVPIHLPQPEKEPLGSEMTVVVLLSCGRLYVWKQQKTSIICFGGLVLQNSHSHLSVSKGS